MLRFLGLLFTLLLLSLIALPITGVLLAVEDEPSVPLTGELHYRDIERARALIERNDPRQLAPGNTQSLELTEEDISVMLRYALSRLVEGGAAVTVDPSGLSAELTARLPQNPLGNWLNMRAGISQSARLVALDYVAIGRVHIPGFIADFLLQQLGQRTQTGSLYRALMDSIEQIHLLSQRVAITYRWQPELFEQARLLGSQMLFSEADRERLLAYTGQISRIAGNKGLASGASLDALTTPLFALAVERSQRGDAAAENRALLTALVVYINKLNLARLIDVPDSPLYRPRHVSLRLQGREDLAQHFSISAAMAANGGSVLADAVGLSKEVDDSSGGSGFSFTDLAADRAGVRFAEALDSSAERSQILLARGEGEGDYMPPVRGLPEFMKADRFAREFGHVGSSAYEAVVVEIEKRIDRLPIHQR